MNIITLKATEEFSELTRKMIISGLECTVAHGYCTEWKNRLIGQIKSNTLFIYDSIVSKTVILAVESVLTNIHPKLKPDKVKIVFYRNNHGSFSLHNKELSILVIPDSCFDNWHSLERNILHEILHGVLRRSRNWSAWKQRLVNLGEALPVKKEYDKSQIGEEYLVQAVSGWEFNDVPQNVSAIELGHGQINEHTLNQILCKFEEVLCLRK